MLPSNDLHRVSKLTAIPALRFLQIGPLSLARR